MSESRGLSREATLGCAWAAADIVDGEVVVDAASTLFSAFDTSSGGKGEGSEEASSEGALVGTGVLAVPEISSSSGLSAWVVGGVEEDTVSDCDGISGATELGTGDILGFPTSANPGWPATGLDEVWTSSSSGLLAIIPIFDMQRKMPYNFRRLHPW